MTCGNVKGQNSVELIDGFLEWAEGREKHKEASRTILCLATNIFDEVGPAVVSPAQMPWSLPAQRRVPVAEFLGALRSSDAGRG